MYSETVCELTELYWDIIQQQADDIRMPCRIKFSPAYEYLATHEGYRFDGILGLRFILKNYEEFYKEKAPYDLKLEMFDIYDANGKRIY